MYVSGFIVSIFDKKSTKKNSQQNFTRQENMLSLNIAIERNDDYV